MTKGELATVISNHKVWLSGTGGAQANLSGADLSGADLIGADLRWSYLSGSNLSGADLSGSDLRWANLSGADLSGSNLSGSDLSGSNLSGSDLIGADLSGAENIPPGLLPSHGSVVGWKKCRDGVIVKLSIAEKTPRSSATGRKCRAGKATVLAVYGAKIGISQYDDSTRYVKGKAVAVKDFDMNRFNECSTGIHFFLTRQEAEDY